MKILVIGSGGREHALLWSLRSAASGEERVLFCAPGNAGIGRIARCAPLSATDVESLANFASEEKIDLTIAGSEAPLASGLVDEFERRGLRVAGPPRDAARLESSKVFAKEFMARHEIPTARCRVAETISDAREILRAGEFGGEEDGVVVKADGLAAGKGVVVARNRREAERAAEEMFEGVRVGKDAARRLIFEETLAGREASLLLFTDGRDYRLMPPARDHKRIGEGDTGPNTGGMGSITSPDVLDEETLRRVVEEIVEPTLAGAQADGLDFRGVLFIGLMLTDEGPKTLEYNVRFGDPEAQAILVRLESDPAEIFDAIANRNLSKTKVSWSEESSACVVLASRGYPEKPETGARIHGLEDAARLSQVQIFHAGTSEASGGGYLTAGGRVLGVTSKAHALEDALARCYEAASLISWDGMRYRRDIGRFASGE